MPLGLIAAFSMPTINAMMSKRVPPNAQGELQGANASLMCLSAMVGAAVLLKVVLRRHPTPTESAAPEPVPSALPAE